MPTFVWILHLGRRHRDRRVLRRPETPLRPQESAEFDRTKHEAVREADMRTARSTDRTASAFWG